jgi:WD40 repeat protein
LVREWPRLRQWVEDDRTDLITLGRVRESAAAWADLDREPSALLRGTALEAALDVAGRTAALAPLEVEYVEASRVARDFERAEQAELIRRQARTNRRLRWQLAGIGVALVVALVGGLIAVNQRQQADRERHIAVARELAAAAEANIRNDPELSILLALAAVDATRSYDEPVLPEAVQALHHGVASARILRSFPGVGGGMDWSPDGKLFVTEGPEDTGIVDIRDAVTGQSVQSFPGDEIDLNQVVFSHDSRWVITASDEGAIRVWDIATGRKLRDVTVGAEGEAWGPSVSPDGRLVAGAWLNSGKVRVIPVAGGEPWVFRAEGPLDTAFSPDGSRLAVTALFSETVHVVDVRTRDEVLKIDVPGIMESDVSWSPDGHWLATGGGEGGRVYDARTGRLRLVTQGSLARVDGVDWSPDGSLVATGSSDGTARVFEVEGRASREVARLAAQDMRNGVRSVAFSPDGTQLMTSDSRITSVKVWDVRTQAAPEIANIPGVPDSVWTANMASPLTPDGRSVWVPDGDGRVSRYDLASGRRVQRLPGRPVGGTEFPRLSLSPDGRLLAVIGDDLPVPVWDTRSGHLAFDVGKGEEGFIPGVDWDHAGEHVAVVIGKDGNRLHFRVAIVDRTGAEVGTILGRPDAVFESVSFSNDGEVLATSLRLPTSDTTQWGIRLWDWRDGRPLERIDASALGVDFDPSGPRLVTWRFLEGVADVWDATSGERLLALEGHNGILSDVAFDATGERVATAGDDGSVRLWDPRTGRQQVVLQPGSPVAAVGVEFSRDGRRVVTTWDDGVTRVWTLDLDELIDIARDRVTRGLTTAECKQYLHVDSCPSS